MLGLSYSVPVIIAIIIHCIIYKDAFTIKNFRNLSGFKRIYRLLQWSILAYYITDVLWGILDQIGMVQLLYVDTVVYYIAMSVAVVLWCEYVAVYLKQDNFLIKALKIFGRLLVISEAALLVVNCFKPIFFYFDSEGVYHAGIVRYIALYSQIVIFVYASIQTLIVAVKSSDLKRRRHIVISLAGMAMAGAIAFQIEFPLLPIYSIGFLVSSCVHHVYVEEDEKKEAMRALKERMNIVSIYTKVFYCSYYIDMTDYSFIELDNKIEENKELIGQKGDAIKAFDDVCKNVFMPQYIKDMRLFTDLTTLNERLSKDKDYISIQFEGVHIGWGEGFFIAGNRDENGKLEHVIWTIRTIREEKERENRLFYNSYIDELTGLYNRKMYSENKADEIDIITRQDFVYLSMDVNGLKTVNDSLGHSAGDELIKGAAECMTKCFGTYGRVYRTGGDEFIAMINASADELDGILKDFENTTAGWKGEYIDSIAVSCGVVKKMDFPTLDFESIERLADERMYARKNEYYMLKGIDRRGQQNAYKAMCAQYTKILKVNLTHDEYSVIFMNRDEQIDEKGFSHSIFKWLEDFAKSGQVHSEDREEYFAKTSKEYLCSYFKEHKALDLTYRRVIGEEFKPVIMEMVVADDYSDELQTIYLYVKNMDK